MKTGIYVPVLNNPTHLRFTLCQIALQTVQPDVISVYVEGDGPLDEFKRLVADLLPRWKVLWGVGGAKGTFPVCFYHPLKALYDDGCGWFIKWDSDNIFRRNHIQTLIEKMYQSGAWIFSTTQSDILEIREKMYRLSRDIEWTWNPCGGMPDATIFNRQFAEVYLPQLKVETVADDVLMGKLMPTVPSAKIDGNLRTATYVSHGTNTSGYIWGNTEYLRQLKERGIE